MESGFESLCRAERVGLRKKMKIKVFLILILISFFYFCIKKIRITSFVLSVQIIICLVELNII